jgi:hypothetical protein
MSLNADFGLPIAELKFTFLPFRNPQSEIRNRQNPKS